MLGTILRSLLAMAVLFAVAQPPDALAARTKHAPGAVDAAPSHWLFATSSPERELDAKASKAVRSPGLHKVSVRSMPTRHRELQRADGRCAAPSVEHRPLPRVLSPRRALPRSRSDDPDDA